MTSCYHMCFHLCNDSQEPFFNKTMFGVSRPRLFPHCYYISLACPIPRFVSNRAYLGLFGTVSWASHEFERTTGKITANMERNVSRHPAITCVATLGTAPISHFSTTQCSTSHVKSVTRLSLHCYYPSLAFLIPRFISNRVYLGSFGIVCWASHEFE
ncbi:uncharacterized protein TNCV_2373461 [Trichonephila clavipes]|nr:uncharacterized protein TNCV_2373461 [Trichonephila clavipes]